MGPVGCPETPVGNYKYSLSNNPGKSAFVIYFAAEASNHASDKISEREVPNAPLYYIVRTVAIALFNNCPMHILQCLAETLIPFLKHFQHLNSYILACDAVILEEIEQCGCTLALLLE